MALALITGASRGIGRATAIALAHRGVDLALFGRPSEQMEQSVRILAETGVRIESFACDIGSVPSIESAAAHALDSVGPPDAIIHNAAVIERRSILDTTVKQWEAQLDTNLRGPFILTRALLPSLLERRIGRIVHVASISSTLGTKNAAAYCASKWGLVGFMKSLAEELKDTGLMTMAVLPGSVDTQMLEGSGFTPRMTADDVARTIVHYAIDAPLAHNGAVVEMFGV